MAPATDPPTDADVRYRDAIALGNRSSAAGRLDAAVGAYREALSQRPGDLEALTNLGATLTRLGQGDAAIEAYRAAIAANPTAVEPQLNLAIAPHPCRSDPGRARRLSGAARRGARPCHRAVLLRQPVGQPECVRGGTRGATTGCWRSDPDHAEAYCNRGVVAAARQDAAAAEADFQAAVSRNPRLTRRLAAARQAVRRRAAACRRHGRVHPVERAPAGRPRAALPARPGLGRLRRERRGDRGVRAGDPAEPGTLSRGVARLGQPRARARQPACRAAPLRRRRRRRAGDPMARRHGPPVIAACWP